MPDRTPLRAVRRTSAASLVAAFLLLTVLRPSHVAAGDPATRIWGTGTAEQNPEIRVLRQDAAGLRLEFTLPAVTVTDLDLGGAAFQSLAIPGGGERGEPGQPGLPVYTRLLAVPDVAGVRCVAIATEEEERGGIRLSPVQDDAETAVRYAPAAYARDDYGDAPFAEVGAPAILRGLRVVPITFAPVRYNPARGTVRVARRLEISVDFRGEDPVNARPERVVPAASSFDRIYRELVVNHEGGRDKAAAGAGVWLLICRNDDQVLTRLQPLIDWRNRKGASVHVATTAETGTTKEQIKSFIQSAYSYWPDPPEYVVLAGDAAGTYGIPTWRESLTSYAGEGDHPYVQLDGNDLLADAHVGRLSFGTLTDLETIVAKMVNYERNPYLTDSSWFTRSCLVGDPNDSGYSTVQVMQWIKNRQRQLGYTQVDTIFSSPFVSQMANALNRGDSYFFYRGIQGMSGWTNSNTYSLGNGWRLPFCVVITCDTGSFESGTSRSEGFLRAGSATTPKGGIGAVGTATSGTHTRYNNCYMFGLGWGAFYHDAWQMGVAHTWGKLNLYLNYSGAQSNMATVFSYWNNLMGDPAGEIWTGVPQPIDVTHPAALPVGTNLVPVQVTESGLPCAGAMVCLYRADAPETQAVAWTDALGQAEVSIPPAAAGTFQLTVTRHNRLPYLTDIQVAAGPYAGYSSHVIDDDGVGESRGDGNGLVSPAEWIELPVTVRNYGGSLAPGVGGVLSSDDPYVTILDAEEPFGDIDAGQTASSAGDFGFALARDCPDGHVVRLKLTVNSGADQWTSALDLEVHAPALALSAYHLSNAGGNGLLDPGETVGLSVAAKNVGDLDAEQTRASLVSGSSYVTIGDPLGAYPLILAGATQENVGDPFSLTAATNCPDGYLAPMKLLIEFYSGVRDTVDFFLPVGTAATSDPLGPDRYGYWAFDNTDTGYPEAPSYAWVEIAPSQGGDGTQVPLGDYGEYQDESRTVTLPFAFTYYGQTFTTATICSNGWIMPGSTYMTDYRNWTLPSPGGPDGVIAPYWDDLIEVSSQDAHVFQKYDAAGHRWIVEWSRTRNLYNQQTETFEVILYDPAHHPTDTGDGIIVFQYATVTNPDGVDGYATVGIESPDNSDGLTYTYFNRYPAAAPILAPGRAIRFVPKRESPMAVEPVARAVFGFDPGTANPFRPGQAVRFALETASPTVLALYDVQGRLVRTLCNAPLTSGGHAVAWDGGDERGNRVGTGVFFLRLAAGEAVRSRRILFVRD